MQQFSKTSVSENCCIGALMSAPVNMRCLRFSQTRFNFDCALSAVEVKIAQKTRSRFLYSGCTKIDGAAPTILVAGKLKMHTYIFVPAILFFVVYYCTDNNDNSSNYCCNSSADSSANTRKNERSKTGAGCYSEYNYYFWRTATILR